MFSSSVETSSRLAVRHYPEYSGTVAVATSAAADSELTIETELASTESIIPDDVLCQLTKNERSRQDVINGSTQSKTFPLPCLLTLRPLCKIFLAAPWADQGATYRTQAWKQTMPN